MTRRGRRYLRMKDTRPRTRPAYHTVRAYGVEWREDPTSEALAPALAPAMDLLIRRLMRAAAEAEAEIVCGRPDDAIAAAWSARCVMCNATSETITPRERPTLPCTCGATLTWSHLAWFVPKDKEASDANR